MPGNMVAEVRVPIESEQDIVVARQRAREIVRELGFRLVDQSRIATAVSELTRNIVRYATDGRGEVLIRPLPDSPSGIGVEIVVQDEGPGIPDVDLALCEGYTTSTGLGMGLPGTRRLVDEMEIDSGPGRRTVVTIRKWHR